MENLPEATRSDLVESKIVGILPNVGKLMKKVLRDLFTWKQ